MIHRVRANNVALRICSPQYVWIQENIGAYAEERSRRSMVHEGVKNILGAACHWAIIKGQCDTPLSASPMPVRQTEVAKTRHEDRVSQRVDKSYSLFDRARGPEVRLFRLHIL
jgi:hypothetical protein